MINWIEKYIVIIVEVLLTIVAVILIFNGIFSVKMLIRAIFILVIMMVYKWMCHKIGISVGNHPLPKTRYEFISKNIDLEGKVEKFMYKPIFKKYPWILDIIYIILKYNPLLWMLQISRWINEKVYDVIVIINGNKDIFFKKHFKIDATKWDWSIGTNKYYIWLKFIFIYPLVRMLLLPRKIREKILEKKSYRGLLRVRFFVYIYSIILLYYGYYDFIVWLTFYQKIIIIYVYFAIIWPILLYIDIWFNKDKGLDHYPYIYPLLTDSCDQSNSLSLYIYNEYGTNYNAYFFKTSYKLKIFSTFTTFSVFSNRYLKTYVSETDKIFIAGPIYEKSISYKERWIYEKAYGISFIAFREMFLKDSMHSSLDRLILIYKKGEETFGKEYINRVYREYLNKAILVYINKLFLAMDIRRLLGFSRNEWMYWPKNELENPYRMIFDLEEQIKGVRKLLIEKININIVPEKYIGIKLYNKILRYVDIFELSIFLGKEIEWTYPVLELSEKGEEVLLRKLAFDAYEKNPEWDKEEKKEEYWDPQITPVIGYEWSFITAEKTTREEGKEYDYEFLNEICKNVESQYMEEYEKLKTKNELVSEKHIKSMLKKYKVI